MTSLNTIIEEENTPENDPSYKFVANLLSKPLIATEFVNTPDIERCEHNVVAKYCFRCKRPDLAGSPKPTQVEIEQDAETGEVLTANGVKLTPDTQEIELNMFNRAFVEKARAVGFTDAQINFLSDTFEFKAEEYD